MAEPARPLPTDDDDTTAFVAAVEEGIADLDAGRTVPYEAVRRWLLSWGTENELPPALVPVVLAQRALADLARIREQIGQDNPAAANRVAVQLLAACDRLEYLPERGRPGLVPNTRELVALWPYVIVYRVTPDGVQVARIWHGAQDRTGK